DDPTERGDRNLGGAASYVDHHRSRSGLHRQSGADRRRHRLLDEMRLARAGHGGGVRDRSLLNLRDAGRDTDHDTRVADVPRAVVGTRDEVPDHLLGMIEVRDHTIAQWTYSHDVRRCPPQHPPRLGADAEHLTGAGADRDHRWLVDDDAAAADV